MSKLDEIAGNHVVMHSTELKKQIKALFLELVGDDPKWDTAKEDYGFRDQGKSELRAELREKINKL